MELEVDHQRFREDAGYRGEVLLEGLKHMCPSPSVLVEVSQLLAQQGTISTVGLGSWGEGLIEEGDQVEAELLRGTSGLSELCVGEEEEGEEEKGLIMANEEAVTSAAVLLRIHSLDQALRYADEIVPEPPAKKPPAKKKKRR
uniref:Uncharacterized protein n=1 Tax=Hemiselmis andersenii TaxID=464988 RepID=A0A6U5C7P4_HEMAN|mmetsp:Transcript_26704/g.64510  ORF Transcript_26704/g.64510 Transcript_26704/m.64510 type:complete len:143 (+) Transcript_26704:124-552(+)